MNESANHAGRGVAAFALVERLMQLLIEKHVLSKLDVLQAIDDITKAAAQRGTSQNDGAQTEAAILAAHVAATLRKRL